MEKTMFIAMLKTLTELNSLEFPDELFENINHIVMNSKQVLEKMEIGMPSGTPTTVHVNTAIHKEILDFVMRKNFSRKKDGKSLVSIPTFNYRPYESTVLVKYDSGEVRSSIISLMRGIKDNLIGQSSIAEILSDIISTLDSLDDDVEEIETDLAEINALVTSNTTSIATNTASITALNTKTSLTIKRILIALNPALFTVASPLSSQFSINLNNTVGNGVTFKIHVNIMVLGAFGSTTMSLLAKSNPSTILANGGYPFYPANTDQNLMTVKSLTAGQLELFSFNFEVTTNFGSTVLIFTGVGDVQQTWTMSQYCIDYYNV